MVGDWAGVMASADAFTCIASVLAAERAQLRRGAGALWQAWTGSAAGNAEDALIRFADDLWPAEQALVKIAEGYQQVAEGIQANSEALGGLISTIVDLAFEIIVVVETGGLAAIREAELMVERFAHMVGTAERIIGSAIELVTSARDYTDEQAGGLGVLVDAHFSPALPDTMPTLPKTPAHR
jgi:hypothetical protein